jgi:hypothetical protein
MTTQIQAQRLSLVRGLAGWYGGAMIGAVGKSREMTRIRREMAAGRSQVAARRLQTLAAMDPADREVHDLLVQIHREHGDLAGAGRWGFLTDAATPEEISAFELAHPCPWVRLRLLRWSGEPEAVESPIGRARLMALAVLAEQSVRSESAPDPIAWIPSARRPIESEPGYPEMIKSVPTVDFENDHGAMTFAAMIHPADDLSDVSPAEDPSAGLPATAPASTADRRALRKALRQAERERRRALRREVRASTLVSVTMIVLLLLLGAAGSLGVVDTMRVVIARFAALMIS